MATDPVADDTQRQLEEASRAIEARAREIEANGGLAPCAVPAATEGHWDDIPVCDREYHLTGTGKVWTHNNAIRDRQSDSYGMRCSGAGKPPKEQP